jgi:hypothetical protein
VTSAGCLAFISCCYAFFDVLHWRWAAWCSSCIVDKATIKLGGQRKLIEWVPEVSVACSREVSAYCQCGTRRVWVLPKGRLPVTAAKRAWSMLLVRHAGCEMRGLLFHTVSFC